METVIEKVRSEEKINIKSQLIFETEKMWKLVIKMAIPTVLMFLSMALYTTIDTLLATTFIGQSGVYEDLNALGSSDAALAIAGWTTPIVGVILGVVIVFNTGAEIRYSSQLSKRKYDDARDTLGSTTTTSVMFSLILAVVIMIVGPHIIESVAGPSANVEAKEQAVMYLRAQMFYIPFVAFFDLTVRAFRTEGKMGWATLVGVIGIPLNLLLDWVFMGLLDTGISGAALASIIGYGTSTILCVGLISYFRNTAETNMLYNWKALRINKQVFIGTLLIGLPFVFRTVATSVNNIAYLGAINDLGGTAIIAPGADPSASIDYWNTTAGAYSQTYMIVWMTVLGLVQGTSSILAYNYGKGEYKRARDCSIWTLIYMIIVSLFFVGIFIGVTPQIMYLFNVTTVDAVNIRFIRITLVRNIFLAISFVPFVYLLNTNQKKQTYLYSIMQALIFGIVIHSVIMTKSSDPEFYKVLPWAITVADFIFLVFALPYHFYKLKHIQRDKEIQNVSTNSAEIRYSINEKYNKKTKTKLNAYRLETAKQTFEWKVVHRISAFASIFTYRAISVSSKKSIEKSAMYRSSVDKKWNAYEKAKKENNIKRIEELEFAKFEIDKGYYDVLKEYKVRKRYGVLFCYDKENSPEREHDLRYTEKLENMANETKSEVTSIYSNFKSVFKMNRKEFKAYIKGKYDKFIENKFDDRKTYWLESVESVKQLQSQRLKDIEKLRNEKIRISTKKHEIFDNMFKIELSNYTEEKLITKIKKKVEKNDKKLVSRKENINKKFDRKIKIFLAFVKKTEKRNKKKGEKVKERESKMASIN